MGKMSFQEGYITFEEKEEILLEAMRWLNKHHVAYTVTSEEIGGCWVETLECPALDLRVEAAAHHSVLNPSLNGSLQAWRDSRVWMVRTFEDLGLTEPDSKDPGMAKCITEA